MQFCSLRLFSLRLLTTDRYEFLHNGVTVVERAFRIKNQDNHPKPNFLWDLCLSEN